MPDLNELLTNIGKHALLPGVQWAIDVLTREADRLRTRPPAAADALAPLITGPVKRTVGRPPGSTNKTKRVLSPEGHANIVAAQKRRWANAKKTAKKKTSASARSSGWPADPEERKREMARRIAVSQSKKAATA